MTELLEHVPLDDSDFTVAKDRLLLAYVSLSYMGGEETRKRAAGRVVTRGLALLRHPDCDESSRLDVVSYLGEFAVSDRFPFVS